MLSKLSLWPSVLTVGKQSFCRVYLFTLHKQPLSRVLRKTLGKPFAEYISKNTQQRGCLPIPRQNTLSKPMATRQTLDFR